MARKISRRQLLAAGAVTAGSGALTGELVPSASAQSAATQKPRAGLPDVWGQDFLLAVESASECQKGPDTGQITHKA